MDPIRALSDHLDKHYITHIAINEAIIITDEYDSKLTLTPTPSKTFHLIGDLHRPEWASACDGRSGTGIRDHGPITIYRFNSEFDAIQEIIEQLNNPTKHKNTRPPPQNHPLIIANCD